MEELGTMEEEERTGEIVEEEGKEKVESVMDWKEVEGDEEEADKGIGENMAVGDEQYEELEEGFFEETNKGVSGEDEEGCAERE